MLNVENIHWQLHCQRGTTSEQMNGNITINGVTISLVYFDTDDLLLLPPTPIIIKTISYLSNTGSLKVGTELDVIINYISLDLSRKHCEILMLIWNKYKKIFGTKTKNSKNIESNNIPV